MRKGKVRWAAGITNIGKGSRVCTLPIGGCPLAYFPSNQHSQLPELQPTASASDPIQAFGKSRRRYTTCGLKRLLAGALVSPSRASTSFDPDCRLLRPRLRILFSFFSFSFFILVSIGFILQSASFGGILPSVPISHFIALHRQPKAASRAPFSLFFRLTSIHPLIPPSFCDKLPSHNPPIYSRWHEARARLSRFCPCRRA